MIPIKIINITLTFPTKRKTVFTYRSYKNKVTKGNTDAELFRFVRVPDKHLVCKYDIEVLSVVGETGVINN